MSGILSAMMRSGTTLVMSVGDDGAAGAYGFSSGVFGSLTPSTFVDKGGVTRTIQGLYWDVASSRVRLDLDGGADTDTTIASLVVNGTVFVRSARSSYTGSPTFLWEWANGGVNPFGTSGTITVLIY